MTGYVDALWVGPYGYRKAPEGLLLETGITVCQIPEGEAHASDNWQVVGATGTTDTSDGQPAVPDTPTGGDS